MTPDTTALCNFGPGISPTKKRKGTVAESERKRGHISTRVFLARRFLPRVAIATYFPE